MRLSTNLEQFLQFGEVGILLGNLYLGLGTKNDRVGIKAFFLDIAEAFFEGKQSNGGLVAVEQQVKGLEENAEELLYVFLTADLVVVENLGHEVDELLNVNLFMVVLMIDDEDVCSRLHELFLEGSRVHFQVVLMDAVEKVVAQRLDSQNALHG